MKCDINAMMDLFERADDDTTRVYLAKALRRQIALFTAEAIRSPEPGPHDWDKVTSEEMAEAKAGRKISAIKLARSRTGMGLKESKELVEWLCFPHDHDGNKYPMPDHVRRNR